MAMWPRSELQRCLVEDLRDEAHVLVDEDLLAVTGRDAGRLLAAVLQRVEPEVRQLGDVLTGSPDAEDPAGVLRALLAGEEVMVQTTVATCHSPSLPHPTASARRRSTAQRAARRAPRSAAAARALPEVRLDERETWVADQAGPSYASSARIHRVASVGRWKRPSVTCGGSACRRASPRPSSTHCVCRPPPPRGHRGRCSTPAHSTRAAYGFGKAPAPARRRTSGSRRPRIGPAPR